jgi:lipopolysaccharide biosynthesis regulator YciM
MQYNLGRVHLGASHFDKAEKIFTELYEKEPDQPRFALRLINCYLSLNKLDLCEKLLNEFLKHETEYSKKHKLTEVLKEKVPENLSPKEKEKWSKMHRRHISRIHQQNKRSA